MISYHQWPRRDMHCRTEAPYSESEAQSQRANSNGNYRPQFNVPHLTAVQKWHLSSVWCMYNSGRTQCYSNHSHRSTLLQEGGLWQWLCEAVGEHLNCRYVAQVDLSLSSHICSMIVLDCNVCNCSSVLDSVFDARDQWLWILEYVRDSRDAELVQEMRDLCESHSTYSKGIVFGTGVDWAVDFCFLNRQSTAPPKVMTNPLVNL